jgi:hypothetical protein
MCSLMLAGCAVQHRGRLAVRLVRNANLDAQHDASTGEPRAVPEALYFDRPSNKSASRGVWGLAPAFASFSGATSSGSLTGPLS